MICVVASPTFFRIYVLLDPSSFSISLARSRDISSDEMFANVQRARPTAYIFEWFMSLRGVNDAHETNRRHTYFFSEFVTNVRTS